MTTKSENISGLTSSPKYSSEMETTRNSATCSTGLGHRQHEGANNHHSQQINYDTNSSSASDVIRSHNFNTSMSSVSFDVSRTRSPLPSGLSALILAATSQLGHLAEVATAESADVPGLEHSRTQSEDTTIGAASSTSELSQNGHNHHYQQQANLHKEKHPKPRQPRQQQNVRQENDSTPKMVPEPDPRKQAFPEILMTLAIDPSNADVITFLPDGKFFAIRTHKFAEGLMRHYFSPPIPTYDEFLEIASEWGFSSILDRNYDDVSVFRHPKFIKGEWEKCACIKHGESPTEVRFSALPNRSRIEYTLSDDTNGSGNSNRRRSNSNSDGINYGSSSNNNNHHTKALYANDFPQNETGHTGNATNSKRRLSPGFMARRDSASSVSSQKQKVEFACNSIAPLHNNETGISSASNSIGSELGVGDEHTIIHLPSANASYCNPSTHADDVRSLALAITTEKLNLKHCGDQKCSNDYHLSESSAGRDPSHNQNTSSYSMTPLVDRAVTSATHTIVTDAIETLLRDEGHTKETYLKHEKELSKSSLPGVVPISKQLFSPSSTTMKSTTASVPVTAAGSIANTKEFSKKPPPSEVAVSSMTLHSTRQQQRQRSENQENQLHYLHHGAVPPESFDKAMADTVKELKRRASLTLTTNSDGVMHGATNKTSQMGLDGSRPGATTRRHSTTAASLIT